MSAKKKAAKAPKVVDPVKALTHDPLTGRAILDAVRCSRCTNVFFANSTQPVLLPDGSTGYLCFADRTAAGIAKRTAKVIPVIVCSRGGEVRAASEAHPIRVPVPSSDPSAGSTIVHMCPACFKQATEGDETVPPEMTPKPEV